MNLEQQNRLDAERRQTSIKERYAWEIKSGHRDPVTLKPIDPSRPVIKGKEV